MDIISIFTAVEFAVIVNLAKEMGNKENITKLVDWVLSFGKYFWEQSENKQSANVEPPAPPQSSEKAKNKPPKSIHLDLNDFATQRKIDGIVSLMNQLNTYSSNLNKDLERAAKLGGIDSPDMSNRLYNSIQDQKKEIAKCFIQLAEIANKLQNEKNDELDDLIKIIEK